MTTVTMRPSSYYLLLSLLLVLLLIMSLSDAAMVDVPICSAVAASTLAVAFQRYHPLFGMMTVNGEADLCTPR